jgi:hypothetical protein
LGEQNKEMSFQFQKEHITINKKEYPCNTFKYTLINNDVNIGLCVFKYYSNESLNIIRLEIDEPHRCKGFGSLLLNNVFLDARAKNIFKVYLIDHSDRRRKINNIYTKFGLIYESNSGNRMTGHISIDQY